MPVEIRELVIRAVVSANQEEKRPEAPTALSEEAYARLVQDCVRQVLLILQREKER